MADKPAWKWHYNGWFGFMWGPVPVAWIIFIAVYVWIYFAYYADWVWD